MLSLEKVLYSMFRLKRCDPAPADERLELVRVENGPNFSVDGLVEVDGLVAVDMVFAVVVLCDMCFLKRRVIGYCRPDCFSFM